LDRIVSRFNGGRESASSAGHGYDFVDCDFSHTGRAGIATAPGAGADIEAESNVNRDLAFTRCSFVEQCGAGMVADSGDSANVVFNECRFVGTTSWSAWPRKPYFEFKNCTFVGAVANAFSDKKDAAALPTLATAGLRTIPLSLRLVRLYLASPSGGPIVDLALSDNVVFARCTFDCQTEGSPSMELARDLPRLHYDSAFRSYRNDKRKVSRPDHDRGTGRSLRFNDTGTVILNGKIMPLGRVGSDFDPW